MGRHTHAREILYVARVMASTRYRDTSEAEADHGRQWQTVRRFAHTAPYTAPTAMQFRADFRSRSTPSEPAPMRSAAAACDERLGHHDPTAPRLVPPLLHAAELDLKDSAHAARDGRERVLARLTPEDDDRDTKYTANSEMIAEIQPGASQSQIHPT